MRLLLIFTAAGLGLAVGAFWRAKVAVSHTNPPARSAVAHSQGMEAFGSRKRLPTLDDSPLTTQLERDLSQSSGVTRWLYWFEALEKAAPSDFPRLARLAQANPAALRLVAARWIEIAPRHLFDALVAAARGGPSLPVPELSRALFKEWPKSNPEGAIAALNEPGDFGTRRAWQSSVASEVFNNDVERGLRLMSEWHIENFGPFMTGVEKWAAPDPRHAAEFTLENSAGYVAQLCMETIGKEWAKTDPAAALAFAASKPGQLSSTLAASALKQWAGQDLEEAAEWLGQADARTRNRLSPAFVEAWAQDDGAGALDWCQENLAGSGLAQAVGGVIKGAAAKDLMSAVGLVTEMDPSLARSEAAATVAKQWFPGLSSDKAVTPEMVSWLNTLDSDSLKRVMEVVEWGWSTSDPRTMAAFLSSANSASIPTQAYSTLARQLAQQNPSEALDWAGSLPASYSIEAGSAAFGQWWSSQPDAATTWLNSLPPSDARRQPFFQTEIRCLAWSNPQASEQLSALSADDRADARGIIQAMNNLPDDRRARLLEALKGR